MEFILTGSPDARLCLQRAICRACLLKDIGRGDGDGPSLHGVRKTLHCSIVLEGLWLPEGMVPRNQRLTPDHQNRSGGRYDAFGLRPRLSGLRVKLTHLVHRTNRHACAALDVDR